MGRKISKITHKVGVKLLTNQQLENVLPTYENLLQKIDICREVAKTELSSNTRIEKRHYQYNFMYDNVFSILGRRGTGKTSVAFTLREQIREQYKDEHDVIMPLIIPEVIPEDCTILGWLLAIIREEIRKLEEEISKLESGFRGEDFWRRCQYVDGQKKEKSLENQLDELSQLFYAKGYNPSGETSYYRAIDNSAKQAEDYYKFAMKVAELWDAWVERIRHLQELQCNKQDCCPMIYFIFDDVDLAPEKIEELLSVIIKYLSHPNIIVITTADEELFLEVIENRFDNKIGRYQRDLRNYLINNNRTREFILREINERDTIVPKYDLISQTARMYLGKVLPTSTRYYLRLFNSAQEKENFCLEDDKNLGNGVAELVQELIDIKPEAKINNFMKDGTKIINFYLKFIGNTSRQIGNVYIALRELVDNLKNIIARKENRERILTRVYQSCRYFLCVAINANHTLSNMVERIDPFVDEIFLYEYNQWNMYCSYLYLTDFLSKKLAKEPKVVKVSVGLQLFSLLAFVENILLVMEKILPNEITKRGKVHAVLPLTEYLGNVAFNTHVVFRNDLDANTFFRHYVNLLNRLEIIVEEEMTDAKFNLEYFYNFRTYSNYKECDIDDIKKMYTENRKWFNTLSEMLSLVYGNVYLIFQKNIEECLVYSNRIYLIRYQKRIDTEIKNNIKDCFMYVNMQYAWDNIQEKFMDLPMEINTDQDDCYILASTINEELMKQNIQEIQLRQLLEIVFQKVDFDIFESWEGVKKYWPTDLQEDLKRNWNKILQDRDVTRNFIRKYVEKIINTSVDTMIVLQDFPNAICVLENCAKCYGSLAPIINEMISRLSSIAQAQDQKVSIVLDNVVYNDLLSIMVKVHKYILERRKNTPFFEEEFPHLKENIEELFGSMDVVVNVEETPSDEFQQAVRLGMLVSFLKILQVIYISQTVHDRYENYSGMSSKELEKVVIDGTKKETYYYQLFNVLFEIIDMDKEEDTVGIPTIGIDDISDDIIITWRNAREHYVDSMIERIENE